MNSSLCKLGEFNIGYTIFALFSNASHNFLHLPGGCRLIVILTISTNAIFSSQRTKQAFSSLLKWDDIHITFFYETGGVLKPLLEFY